MRDDQPINNDIQAVQKAATISTVQIKHLQHERLPRRVDMPGSRTLRGEWTTDESLSAMLGEGCSNDFDESHL